MEEEASSSGRIKAVVCSINVLIGIATFGVVASFISVFIYGLHYRNYVTCILCISSSAFASILLYLHISYKRRSIFGWKQSSFTRLFIINMLAWIFAFFGMIAFLVVAGVKHQTLTNQGMHGENYWMAATWSYFNFKWSLLAAIYARKYGNITNEMATMQFFEDAEKNKHWNA